jgi:trehalose-6-phosphatase
MIFAVDFDGTVVTHDYPKIGQPLLLAIPTLIELSLKGHQIILWTMRSNKELEEAVSYLKDNGVPLHGVNENPNQKSWTQSSKAYAHMYIDDAALGCPLIKNEGERPFVDWLTVRSMLKAQNLIDT